MNINTNNYKQFTFFTVFLLGLSTMVAYVLFLILNQYFIKLPTYAQIFVATPSVPVIYAFLFTFFDKYLWKQKIFRQLGIIISYNLNGIWEGTLRSSFDKFSSDITVKLIINQTATGIKIHSTFDKSRSISVYENFGRSDIDNQVALYYFYRNEPNYDSDNTMSTHEGSVKLLYNSEDDTLTGNFYSGRDRNNYGTIKVKRIKKF